MHLHEPPRPAPRPIGSIELKQSVHAAIVAASPLHRLILFDRCLRHKLFEVQHLLYLGFLHLRHELRQVVLSDRCREESLFPLDPPFELFAACGIRQACKCFGMRDDAPLEICVKVNRLRHKLRIDADAAIVDALIELPQLLLPDPHREVGETPADLSLGHNIAHAVIPKRRPFLRRVSWQIPFAAAVDFRGLAGLAKIRDQLFADAHFCFVICEAQRL